VKEVAGGPETGRYFQVCENSVLSHSCRTGAGDQRAPLKRKQIQDALIKLPGGKVRVAVLDCFCLPFARFTTRASVHAGVRADSRACVYACAFGPRSHLLSSLVAAHTGQAKLRGHQSPGGGVETWRAGRTE
jgi:hypothetical protein